MILYDMLLVLRLSLPTLHALPPIYSQSKSMFAVKLPHPGQFATQWQDRVPGDVGLGASRAKENAPLLCTGARTNYHAHPDSLVS